MPKSINEILGNDVLNEDIKRELSEAFDARIAEEREELTAVLREEFATRYENDKAQIVDAMDTMLKEAIKTELEEFAQDKAKLAEERVRYKKSIKSHTKMIETFVNDVLTKEIRELRGDRKTQKVNFGKLEEFVLKQLSRELNEFHEDKRALAEQKVKLVREGKKAIQEAKKAFVRKSAERIHKLVESTMRKELVSLREDIQTAKENEFGRKIFETFASEFMTNTLSENTQVAKLAKNIVKLKSELAESNKTINKTNKALLEAKREVNIVKDKTKRKAIMSEMLDPLNKSQKDLMGTLLESVKTSQLQDAYKKYLPSVLNEDDRTTTKKTRLTENKSNKNVTGDEGRRAQHEAVGSADIIEIKKLAGLS